MQGQNFVLETFLFRKCLHEETITMLTRILASSVRTIPWTLGSPFLSFFITGGFCALAMGLQRYIKAMGGGGGGQLYIYIYM